MGLDKKDTSRFGRQCTGANTFYELVNGLFEDTKLKWNTGKPNTDLIDRFYEKQQEKSTFS